MKEKISNTIFLKQQSINELNELKEKVKRSDTEKIRFIVETKHWYGYTHLIKDKNKLNISKYTMLKIIDKAIEEEKVYIDKLIDMEIESRGVINMDNMEVKKLDLKLEKGHAVCFDFDGVIHKYSKGWQDGSIYDEYNKNVLDLMLFLQKAGMPIFICSTREPYQIINWWNKQGFWCDAVRVNDNETFWNELKLIGVTNRKLPAQMYIDDRAYKYTGQTVKQFMLGNSEELKEGE